MSEDLPKEITESRKKLFPVMEKFRKEGKKVMFRLDKLVIDGKVWDGNTDEEFVTVS